MRELKHMLALAICLALCLAPWGAAQAEEEDPVCVRVGDFSYPLSLAQQSLDSAIKLSESMSDEPMSPEAREQMAEDVIENLVGVGLIEAKLTEAGQHDFTDEEREQMNAAASSRYEELWQSAYQAMVSNDANTTEEEVAQMLEKEGYSIDALYREYEVSERQRRAIELYVPSIMITEDDVNAYYESQFLAPDRARYKDNIPRYEREILAANNESFYTPEGYRYVRQILLEYPDEAIDALEPNKERVESAARAVSEALAKLTEVASTTDDWSNLDEPRANYDALMAALEEEKRAYLEKRNEVAMPLVQGTIDEINVRLKAGIDFKSLISKYSADTSEQNVTGTGYPLHPDSEGWPEDFIAAGMALEKPGDVSEPVLTEKGIHILYYDSDVPAGDHVLTDDERELLNKSALHYYQVEELMKLFEEWKTEYDIETHVELLKY